MSQNEFRLPLDWAEALAAKIVADLAPVCERIEAAGSVRRRCETVGDIELVCIPKFSRSLLPDIPGVSLLDMHLVALMGRGRLQRASDTPIEELKIKSFYLPALVREGHFFKLEINVTDADAWPVCLAIKTGPAEFSHRLVCNSDNPVRGFLPRGWRIADSWRVYEPDGTGGERRRIFETEREFIEQFCGRWLEPWER